MFLSRIHRLYPVLNLVLLGAFCLSACSPSNQPVPAATATVILPTQTPASTPTATILPTPTKVPAPACLSRAGRIVDGVLDTVLLAKPMRYHVYLPPCYAEEPQRRYPVLYLLHGQGYDEEQWVRLGAPTTADGLIASKEISPLIMVFPYDYSHLQPREYRFEDTFMEVLIPQIDMAYRTRQGAAQRAIGGLSRGGAWALHLGIHHPDVFGSIGAHSPAIFSSDTGSLPLYLRDIPAEKLPRIYIDAGDADSQLQTSQNFKKFLDAGDIPHEWHQYVGFHNEDYWGAHVEDYLRWYAQGW
jgi:enterochelin esterase-like enzyme